MPCFGCVDCHDTTTLRISHLSRNAEAIVAYLAGEDEVMVIAVTELDLRMLAFETVANGMSVAEIEGRTLDRHKLTKGMRLPSTGVMASAQMRMLSSLIVESPSPARLKNEWLVKLMTVGLSVVAL